MEVYKDNVLVFVGSAKAVAEFIGVSASTIYNLRSGSIRFLPKKADCDMVVDGTYVWGKDENRLTNVPNKIDVGYSTVVKGKTYTITNIEKRGDNYIYQINDYTIRAKKRIENYNTLYVAIKRKIEYYEK